MKCLPTPDPNPVHQHHHRRSGPLRRFPLPIPIFPRVIIVPRHLLVRIRARLAFPPVLAFVPPPPMRGAAVAVAMPVAVVSMPVFVVVAVPAFPVAPPLALRIGVGRGRGGGVGGGLVARLAYGARTVVDAADWIVWRVGLGKMCLLGGRGAGNGYTFGFLPSEAFVVDHIFTPRY